MNLRRQIWTPPMLGGCVAWWTGQHFFTPASWGDLANVQAPAIQATGAKQPSLTANAKNNRPGVAFTGSQYMTHGLRLQPPCTIAAVFKYASDGSGGYAAVAAFGLSLGGTFLFADAGGVGGASWGLYHSGNVMAGVSMRDGLYRRCIAVIRAYNDCDLITDGVLAHVTTGVSAYAADSLLGAGLSNGGQNMLGTLSELLAFNRALTTADWGRINARFGEEYAL